MTSPASGPLLELSRLPEELVRNDIDFVVVGGSVAGFPAIELRKYCSRGSGI